MTDNKFSYRAHSLFFGADDHGRVHEDLTKYINTRCSHFGIPKDDPLKHLKLIAVLATKFDDSFEVNSQPRKSRRLTLDDEQVYADIETLRCERTGLSVRKAADLLRKESRFRNKYQSFTIEAIRKAYARQKKVVQMFHAIFERIDESRAEESEAQPQPVAGADEAARDRSKYGDW